MQIQADNKKLHRWFRVMYLIIGVEIAAMIVALVALSDPIQRIGAVLIIGAMIYLAYQLRLHTLRVRAARTNVERTTIPSTEFTLAYLHTRREFHSGIWFWSRLAVLLPGLPVMVYGFARAEPDTSSMAYGIVGGFAVMIVVAIRVQHKVARRYQLQIDELNRFQRQA